MEYPYVKYLNQSTTNYPVTKLVNRFIARDSNKEYAFEVAFFCGTGRQTTGAKIKVYKPDFVNQKLVYLGVVDAGTNLSPSDLDTGQVEAQNSQCEFEEYFVDVYPQYRVFEFEINTTNMFECDVEAKTEFLVNWGDGESTMYSSGSQTITHTYSTAQQRTITLTSTNKEFLIALDFKSQSNVTFDIKTLPQGFETLIARDVSNSIYGNIGHLTKSMKSLVVDGSNNISGDIESAQDINFIDFWLTGNTTVTGDIRFFSSSITGALLVHGSNTLYGDLFNLKCRPLILSLLGNNTITGAIRWLSSQSVIVEFFGQNTVSGSVEVLNTQLVIQFRGDSELYGDIGKTSTQTIVFVVGGNSTPTGYTSKTWPSDMEYVDINAGLTASEIDQLLIDLSLTTWRANSLIEISGTRTSASDAAVLSLEAQGVTVTVA